MTADKTVRTGSHVAHVADPEAHGIGTVTEVDGQRCYVAWSMPGSTSVARWEDAEAIRLARPEEIEAAREGHA
jgi:hypothetical protein